MPSREKLRPFFPRGPSNRTPKGVLPRMRLDRSVLGDRRCWSRRPRLISWITTPRFAGRAPVGSIPGPAHEVLRGRSDRSGALLGNGRGCWKAHHVVGACTPRFNTPPSPLCRQKHCVERPAVGFPGTSSPALEDQISRSAPCVLPSGPLRCAPSQASKRHEHRVRPRPLEARREYMQLSPSRRRSFSLDLAPSRRPLISPRGPRALAYSGT